MYALDITTGRQPQGCIHCSEKIIYNWLVGTTMVVLLFQWIGVSKQRVEMEFDLLVTGSCAMLFYYMIETSSKWPHSYDYESSRK